MKSVITAAAPHFGDNNNEQERRRKDDSRKFSQPILLDDREVSHEALRCLNDLVVDDPACRGFSSEEN